MKLSRWSVAILAAVLLSVLLVTASAAAPAGSVGQAVYDLNPDVALLLPDAIMPAAIDSAAEIWNVILPGYIINVSSSGSSNSSYQPNIKTGLQSLINSSALNWQNSSNIYSRLATTNSYLTAGNSNTSSIDKNISQMILDNTLRYNNLTSGSLTGLNVRPLSGTTWNVGQSGTWTVDARQIGNWTVSSDVDWSSLSAAPAFSYYPFFSDTPAQSNLHDYLINLNHLFVSDIGWLNMVEDGSTSVTEQYVSMAALVSRFSTGMSNILTGGSGKFLYINGNNGISSLGSLRDLMAHFEGSFVSASSLPYWSNGIAYSGSSSDLFRQPYALLYSTNSLNYLTDITNDKLTDMDSDINRGFTNTVNEIDTFSNMYTNKADRAYANDLEVRALLQSIDETIADPKQQQMTENSDYLRDQYNNNFGEGKAASVSGSDSAALSGVSSSVRNLAPGYDAGQATSIFSGSWWDIWGNLNSDLAPPADAPASIALEGDEEEYYSPWDDQLDDWMEEVGKIYGSG